jgi:hypothetical protein
MKILLAFLTIALAAVLLVSATMGADTLVPGGQSAKKPAGTIGGGPTGRARLVPVGLAPLMVKGIGFKPRETVILRSPDSLAKTKRTVTANAAGSFVARMGTSADRCNGMTVVATGNKGSKASFNFSQVVCAASGAGG